MSPHDATSRFTLGRELGRGGLGRVVEAHEMDLDRTVAIKLVREDLPPELAERFIREARLTARLEHPNIVPIHEFAMDGARGLMLSMKRVQGRDLGQLLAAVAAGREPEWTRPRLLRVFQDICQGVAFAHSQGVIHRDLKPANVMIGDFGEVLIVDWGLAKERRGLAAGSERRGANGGERTSGETGNGDTTGKQSADPCSAAATEHGVPRSPIAPTAPDPNSRRSPPPDAPAVGSPPVAIPEAVGEATRLASAGLTLEGDVVGTPAYMSPEQASGRVADIDERSDIYALGAILYEMLTFVPPVEGNSLAEVLSHAASGLRTPPSQRVRASMPGAPDLPPELDAICLKALALRKEDRHASARDLHRDVQLFLEGVMERERRKREALDHAESGRRWLARYCELTGEIEAAREEVRQGRISIKPSASVEEKRPLWDSEARLAARRDERADAFSKAGAAFERAISGDPALEGATEGLCELLFARYLEAEAVRNHEEMRFRRNALALHDASGKFAAKIEAPGRLSIRAFAFDCDCLRPVADRGWRVAHERTCTIAWRDGRPRHGVPLVPDDLPVPEMTLEPAGKRYGHSARCPRRELAGVPVTAAKFELRDKRFVLGPERPLGVTPLAGVALPAGSWVCFLRPEGFAPLRVPVRIERGGAWSQDVRHYRPADIPDGACPVPAGPFIFSSHVKGEGSEMTRVTDDFFVARFPVTCGEYLEFLNALAADGRLEEARRSVPRDGERALWVEEAGRFRLPLPGEDRDLAWDARWPVFFVTWFDALAWCEWRSARVGRPVTLLHEEEFEKSCRGVDGRAYSYGEEFDGAYSHCNESLPQRVAPMPVDTFPSDESPYGVRGLSGGIQTWCLNAAQVPWRDMRLIRGGSWGSAPNGCYGFSRTGHDPRARLQTFGFRWVVRPWDWKSD